MYAEVSMASVIYPSIYRHVLEAEAYMAQHIPFRDDILRYFSSYCVIFAVQL
jgi:hypothetical protein